MRVCEICGKRSIIQKSGVHQYGGGWAKRATKKRAVWMVNLHYGKVTYRGVRRTMRLCTKCLRRVKALSPRHSDPFDKTQGKLREESNKQSLLLRNKKEALIAPKVKESTPVATA